MLGEGRWICGVERGRFPFPTEILDKFGSLGTWAKETSGWIVLYPTRIWKEEVLLGVDDPQQFRIVWQPHNEKMDHYGRMMIPLHFREELGRRILLISMEKYLKVRRENGENLNPGTNFLEAPRPFRSEREAERALAEGREVIYIGYEGRRIEGKFTGRAGSFFYFVGKDENGIIVPVKEHWSRFYLLKQEGRKKRQN